MFSIEVFGSSVISTGDGLKNVFCSGVAAAVESCVVDCILWSRDQSYSFIWLASIGLSLWQSDFVRSHFKVSI